MLKTIVNPHLKIRRVRVSSLPDSIILLMETKTKSRKKPSAIAAAINMKRNIFFFTLRRNLAFDAGEFIYPEKPDQKNKNINDSCKSIGMVKLCPFIRMSFNKRKRHNANHIQEMN